MVIDMDYMLLIWVTTIKHNEGKLVLDFLRKMIQLCKIYYCIMEIKRVNLNSKRKLVVTKQSIKMYVENDFICRLILCRSVGVKSTVTAARRQSLPAFSVSQTEPWNKNKYLR